MNKEKVELLAPAGSFQALVAACESGADAVYLGGSRFSARAGATNFSDDELAEGIRYAHVRGTKVYIALNTLIREDEFESAIQYVDFLYEADIDALILQDLGLAKVVHNRYPDLTLHGSTQMTVHNLEGARYLKTTGFSRIVLPRELGLKEIEEIKIGANIEVEAFIHGALCVSWSGQCLMSSLIGGRSGNRGRCAQPCRKKYKRRGPGFTDSEASYSISTRDLNTIDELDRLIESGITSLKIEGRMKSPEYVGITVANYREGIDNFFELDRNRANYELRASFNREFTKGYILGHGGRELISESRPDNRGIFLGQVISQKENFLRIKLAESFVEDGDGIEIEGPDGYSGIIISGLNVNGSPGKRGVAGDTVEVYTGRRFEKGSLVRKTMDKSLTDKANEEYIKPNRKKIAVMGHITLKVGEPGAFHVQDLDGNSGEAVMESNVEAAAKKAADLDSLRLNLEKTGDTPFLFREITGDIGDLCFMPISVVNELRRRALGDLEKKREKRNGNRRKNLIPYVLLSNKKEKGIPEAIRFIPRVETFSQGLAAVDAGATEIDLKWDSFLRIEKNRRKNSLEDLHKISTVENLKIWAVLPNIIKESEGTFLGELKDLVDMKLLYGVVLNELGTVQNAINWKIPYRVGSHLNVFNEETVNIYASATGVQLSEELNLDQIRELHESEKVAHVCLEGKVYGRAIAMTLEYCPFESNECEKNGGTSCPILRGSSLSDNTGREFPLRRSLDHRVQLMNSSCLMMLGELKKLSEAGIRRYLLDFSEETPEAVREVVAWCRDKESEGLDERIELPVSLGRLGESGEMEYTKGHYFRGVL